MQEHKPYKTSCHPEQREGSVCRFFVPIVLRMTFAFLLIWGSLSLHAKEYTIQEIPMVHLQDRTRYVSNPDGILSASAVVEIEHRSNGINTQAVDMKFIKPKRCV